MDKDKRLMEASWWEDFLRRKGLVLMGTAMLHKSLVQFSVDGQGCVPSCCLIWGQTMLELMKIMVISFKRSHAHSAILIAPDPETGHCWPMPPLETPEHSWASLGQSLLGSLLLSAESWCTQGFVCALQESVFPVLWKFWWLYSGVNGDLLQEGLCHTQVCCTHGPCGRPLLTCTSTGDIHALKGRSCSVSVESPGAHKVLFEFSEHLWWVWGLILNMSLPLLPSCFSFALGCGVYILVESKYII